jgi:ribose/xylose/arabinose/galactoside ABC-type transport system permease subunit
MEDSVVIGWRHFKERGVLLVFIGLCAVFSILTPNFRQVPNLINIMRQISEISIAAVGMTFIIICAEIDLSVGSVYGLSAIVAAIILRSGLGGISVPLAFLGALAVGASIGLVNGVITTKLKVPAFIVTLSVLAIARGAVYGVTGG